MTEIDRTFEADVVHEPVISALSWNWNALAHQIHQDNVAKGFWPGGVAARNVGELLALVHSELSEAYQAMLTGESDDKLTQYPGFDVEIADAMIRLLDAASAYEVDLELNEEDVGIDPYLGVSDHLCIVHFQISNALEGHRKGNTELFKSAIKTAFFYLANLCHHYAIDFLVIDDKLAYNRSRPFMHGKKY